VTFRQALTVSVSDLVLIQRESLGAIQRYLCFLHPRFRLRNLRFEEIPPANSAQANAISVPLLFDALDASSLLMPLVFFMAPGDPRMVSTVDAIRRQVGAGGLAADGLVYRYDPAAAPDGLPGREGTFNMCSFWLVEALTRAGRTDPSRLDDARLLFEQMLGYANHVGLYAEQTGASGQALGNFPQAFTHLALIDAAITLNDRLDEAARQRH
jgi:GH15 family glucan-1,4-alpha-glucosidase